MWNTFQATNGVCFVSRFSYAAQPSLEVAITLFRDKVESSLCRYASMKECYGNRPQDFSSVSTSIGSQWVQLILPLWNSNGSDYWKNSPSDFAFSDKWIFEWITPECHLCLSEAGQAQQRVKQSAQYCGEAQVGLRWRHLSCETECHCLKCCAVLHWENNEK